MTLRAKYLVVTADDFGVAQEVNEAVEIAHTDGILTAASLMVTGPAAADAIARARRLPRLGVGLHLVLTDGRPALTADQVPDLVDRDGRFHASMVKVGLALVLSASVRHQFRSEIEHQFATFAATGLPCDHVNAHKHFHVHPVLAGMVIAAAVRHRVPALRAPVEPGWPTGSGWVSAPFAWWLRRRARNHRLRVPDRIHGLAHSGRMNVDRIGQVLRSASGGLAELYLHPATCDDFAGHGPGYLHRHEFEGLTSARSRSAVRINRIHLTSFRALVGADPT